MSKVDITYGVSPKDLTAEQMAVFKEGLFKSKGASNTRFGANLAVAGATADEIARLCANVTDRQYLAKSSFRTSPNFRAVLQVVREVPNFWDTVKGRKLKERGSTLLTKLGLDPDKYLPVTKFDAKLSDLYLNRSFRATGESYCMFEEQRNLMYNSEIGGKIVMVDLFEPLTEVKFADEQSLQTLGDNTCKKGSPLPDYDKNRKYEVESLAHMDEEITSMMKPQKLMIDVLAENFDHNFRHYPNSTSSVQVMCLMEGFYAVCCEMGIVGILDNAASGRYWVSQATAKGVMKNVIKLAGTYRRLVKSGFAESVARETVLAEINDNIMKRASRPQLRFYPRNDYKDTPEEERENIKKASGTGTPRKRVLTLEEFVEAMGLKEEE